MSTISAAPRGPRRVAALAAPDWIRRLRPGVIAAFGIVLVLNGAGMRLSVQPTTVVAKS